MLSTFPQEHPMRLCRKVRIVQIPGIVTCKVEVNLWGMLSNAHELLEADSGRLPSYLPRETCPLTLRLLQRCTHSFCRNPNSLPESRLQLWKVQILSNSAQLPISRQFNPTILPARPRPQYLFPYVNATLRRSPTSQNILENYPSFLLLLGLASVNRPMVAGVAGAIRLAGFVAYVIGYRVRAWAVRVCVRVYACTADASLLCHAM